MALLARQAQAPVVPARVSNTTSFFGPEPFTVRFGEPMAPPAPDAEGRDQDRAYAERVMERIFQL